MHYYASKRSTTDSLSFFSLKIVSRRFNKNSFIAIIIKVCSLYKCFNKMQQINNFYFRITYGVCKKRKYCNRMSKKKFRLLMNVHGL